MFARMGRQCYNIHLSVTGYLSRKLCVSGRALIARGLTRCFSCVLLCCATVQRGRPQPFDRYSHPASPPRDTTPVFSFHNCYLSMTTFMVVARSSVLVSARILARLQGLCGLYLVIHSQWAAGHLAKANECLPGRDFSENPVCRPT